MSMWGRHICPRYADNKEISLVFRMALYERLIGHSPLLAFRADFYLYFALKAIRNL
jgi:hypothetical protein